MKDSPTRRREQHPDDNSEPHPVLIPPMAWAAGWVWAAGWGVAVATTIHLRVLGAMLAARPQ